MAEHLRISSHNMHFIKNNTKINTSKNSLSPDNLTVSQTFPYDRWQKEIGPLVEIFVAVVVHIPSQKKKVF